MPQLFFLLHVSILFTQHGVSFIRAATDGDKGERTSLKPRPNGAIIPANQSLPPFSLRTFDEVGTRDLSVTLTKALAYRGVTSRAEPSAHRSNRQFRAGRRRSLPSELTLFVRHDVSEDVTGSASSCRRSRRLHQLCAPHPFPDRIDDDPLLVVASVGLYPLSRGDRKFVCVCPRKEKRKSNGATNQPVGTSDGSTTLRVLFD